ncbi:unnamed protein product [Ostreobium quekettii]|uniref:Mitochondrial carrier protein n=1 Tax=Ostreobium quekettii TaxID=121088 RepID=A0A8S1IXH0_9CHLO|nr:unnamed protein product [Ostreobium quekettii]|eukprot:evm.model.scf_425EXC.10 EVM.evm.TU.scf_425EXC.10   scf_425EXC:54726-56172(-)
MSLLVGPLYFASYSAAKRLATNWSKQPSNLSPTEKQASVKKGGHGSANNGQRGVQGWIAINMFASLVAGVAVSLVESPSELFRHQVQAGVVERGMFPTMLAATRRGGLRSLYFCYLPYLIKALPHDVAELMTYGLLTDARSVAHAHPRHPLGAIAAVPDRVGDLFVGAAAGIMAVLVSMPADTISTRMQTVERAGLREKGPLGMAVSFFATGRRLAARGGVGALYKGCAPRLLRHVPASMVFWPVLVGCQRELHRALGYTEG